jgi:hypothetical protein
MITSCHQSKIDRIQRYPDNGQTLYAHCQPVLHRWLATFAHRQFIQNAQKKGGDAL